MAIRKCEKADFKTLKAIGMACYDKTIDPNQKNFIARLLFLRYFSKHKFKSREKLGVEIYGYEVDGKIVGFYELEPNGCLASLYVDPTYHKQGYGKALLKHSIECAKKLNLKEMTLDASEFAVQFYEHFGFKKTKKPQVVLGVWMVTMKAKID